MIAPRLPSSRRTIPLVLAKVVRHWRACRRVTSPPVCMGEATPNAGTIAPDLVRAMVPERILQEDEIVLLLTKPSLFFIFSTSALFLAVVLVLGALVAQSAWLLTSASLSSQVVGLIAMFLCIGRLIWALLVWTSHTYMLTNRRIVTIKGVINVHVFQAQLRKIQKTELYQPLSQRVFGTGTVAFATAAAADTVDSTWVMIARPTEVHEQVVAAIHKAQSK
jgi:uncharacterized membrane protein YdbT with pleckstrin-like domain